MGHLELKPFPHHAKAPGIRVRKTDRARVGHLKLIPQDQSKGGPPKIKTLPHYPQIQLETEFVKVTE